VPKSILDERNKGIEAPVLSENGFVLDIKATVSSAASDSISLSAFQNAKVTAMVGGDDKDMDGNASETGLMALKKEVDQILREYQIRIETLQRLSVPPKQG
jgi:hypothetical protein